VLLYKWIALESGPTLTEMCYFDIRQFFLFNSHSCHSFSIENSQWHLWQTMQPLQTVWGTNVWDICCCLLVTISLPPEHWLSPQLQNYSLSFFTCFSVFLFANFLFLKWTSSERLDKEKHYINLSLHKSNSK
jgi:hypothetical protein